jgi:hypothetical protein
LWSGAFALVAFLIRFIAIALLVFWKSVLNPGSINSNGYMANLFVSIYFLAFIGLAVLGVVAFRLSKFQNHCMMVLISISLFLALCLHSADVSSRRVGVYISVVRFLAVAVLIGVGVCYATDPQKCWKYNFFMP